jgi:hypothetical protein
MELSVRASRAKEPQVVAACSFRLKTVLKSCDLKADNDAPYQNVNPEQSSYYGARLIYCNPE